MFKKFLNLNFNLPKFGTGEGINRYKYIIFFVIFLFSINIKSFGVLSTETGSDGKTYYQIKTKDDLKEFAQMVNGEGAYEGNKKSDANAILKDNIIFNDETKIKDGVPVGSEQENWTPIGNNSAPYTGTFDGNGKTISGLYFNNTNTNDVGLFGAVQNGVIKNIGVKNSYFKANSNVGGLIGMFYVNSGGTGKGYVTSSYSSGCTVTGTGDGAYVGGLIGTFYVNSGETGEGYVTSSYSSGCTVEGGSSASVGGLIGWFWVKSGGTGEVTSSYSSGCTVTGTGYEAKVGGLIGYFYVNSGETGEGYVTSSYSSGCTVTGYSAYVGGLIGNFSVESEGTGAVTSSYSSGCTVTGGAYVGGLIGWFYVGEGGTGAVMSSYSSGCTVEGGSSASVGGLIGYFDVYSGTGAVRSSYSSGCTVEGGSGAKVGGLIGYFYVYSGGTGAVTSSYSGCTVTGTGDYANVGGLIGRFYVGEGKGEVTSSYSSGCTVEGTGDEAKVGGLIGMFYVEGTGEVTSSYSSGCTVTGTGDSAYVGGLIGWFYVEGTGEVTSSYSSGCTVEGTGDEAKVGGLIGYFYVYSGGKGEVRSSYSSGCTVEGGSSANVGGLIGRFYVYSGGKGEVTSSYSSGCTVEGTGDEAKVGGLIGYFYVEGTGAVTKCFYLTTQDLSGVGDQEGAGAKTVDVTKVTDVEFKGTAISSGTYTNKTVLAILNEGVIDSRVKKIERDYESNVAGLVSLINSKLKPKTDYTEDTWSKMDASSKEGVLKRLAEKLIEEEKTNFKQDNEVDQDGKNRGSGYPVHTWSNRVAYVFGSGDQTEVIKREYVHPVDNYKLTQKIKINNFEAKFDWVKIQDDLSSKVTEVKVGENKSVTVFAYNTKLLKIPVRVKINYDPSNKLETWVESNLKHEFFRQKTGESSWEEMLQNIHYVYTVSPVENSIKINPDGSKTQDFVFNYYIYHAKDENNNIYKFGFNKKYPVNTYIRQDVGGGKKLYIDYGVWGRE